MGLTGRWILAIAINQPAKFNRNPPRRAEDYGSYMTNIHTLCRFCVRSRQVLRHTRRYPGFLQKVKGTAAWKVTIHLQFMPKNGWIHTFTPPTRPHGAQYPTSTSPCHTFIFAACCLIYRPSCACTRVQLGLSHYRQNLGCGGSTTGH